MALSSIISILYLQNPVLVSIDLWKVSNEIGLSKNCKESLDIGK